MIEPLTSVLRAVPLNPPRLGDTGVVIGADPGGLLAMQVVRRCHGVGRLVGLERDPARRAAAVRLGAGLTFDPEDQADELRGFADEHLGAFADHAFDALPHIERSAGLNTRSDRMHFLRTGGRYIIFGATGILQSFDTRLLLSRGLQIGSAPFDGRSFLMARTAHVMQVALSLVTSSAIDIESMVTGTVAFL